MKPDSVYHKSSMQEAFTDDANFNVHKSLDTPLVRREKWYLDIMVKVCLMFVPTLVFIPPSDPNRTMKAR